MEIAADLDIAAALVAGGVKNCALHNADVIGKHGDVAAGSICIRCVEQSGDEHC